MMKAEKRNEKKKKKRYRVNYAILFFFNNNNNVNNINNNVAISEFHTIVCVYSHFFFPFGNGKWFLVYDVLSVSAHNAIMH